ncbi:MAG: hypothetical protein JSS31_18020 [Proteobacteria bacterium]|nr:hypothetical protein [Pseudomonadota bacterium]
MAWGKKRSKGDSGRVAGGFVALPWSVLDCPAWQRLSHPARSLLLELARQLGPDNNGRLLASSAYLAKRGWRSHDVIGRALRELVEVKFLHQTVQGQRPNKASWYAVTWQKLGSHEGFDHGTAETFRRGAFMDDAPLPPPKPTREELYRKWDKPADKNASLSPSGGVDGASIAPSGGVEASSIDPSGGAINHPFDHSLTPSGGHLLEVTIYPSETAGQSGLKGKARGRQKGRSVIATEGTSAAV